MKKCALSLFFSFLFMTAFAQEAEKKRIIYLKDGSMYRALITSYKYIDNTIGIKLDDKEEFKVPRKQVSKIRKIFKNRHYLKSGRNFKNNRYLHSIGMGLNVHYYYSSFSTFAKVNYFIKPKLT